MKAKSIFLFALVGLLSNCNPKNQESKNKPAQNMELNGKDDFERIDDKYSNGTSLIKHREGINLEAPVGDFLSRIWYLYGKPDDVSDEGFGYSFRDVNTGLVFTAYSAGSGPAYGGDFDNEENLLPIINKFDKMLAESRNADCEISMQTDFGTLISGSKNGVPFDRLAEE